MLKAVPLIAAGALAVVTTAAPAPSIQNQATFKAEAELVILHVTVKDRNGGYVGGLTADAFRVFEEGRPQPVQFFAPEDAPVTIGVLIDGSGSMQRVRDQVVDAAAAFMDACNPRDEVFALTFNDYVQAALPASAPFTSDTPTLRARLLTVFVPRGRTALYDAVSEGLTQVARGTRDRRALTVLSDGGDNASHIGFKDALARVQSSNAVIYTVAIVDPNEPEASPGKLKELAETSGGAAFSPHGPADIARAFQDISREIRQGYTVGYAPPANGAGKAGFRRLRVEVRAADGRRLIARTRLGYLAGHAEGGSGAR